MRDFFGCFIGVGQDCAAVIYDKLYHAQVVEMIHNHNEVRVRYQADHGAYLLEVVGRLDIIVDQGVWS